VLIISIHGAGLMFHFEFQSARMGEKRIVYRRYGGKGIYIMLKNKFKLKLIKYHNMAFYGNMQCLMWLCGAVGHEMKLY